jgi:tetratricopeptide (TPR) repeat protein
MTEINLMTVRELLTSARTQKRSGRTSEAASCLRRALEVEPASFDVLVEMADLLFDCGELKDALPYYDRALELDAASAGVLAKKAKLLKDLDETAEGGIQCDRALSIAPNSPEILTLCGDFYSGVDDAKAGQLLRKAMQIAPDYAPAVFAAGNLCLQQGELQNAQKHFARAVKLDDSYREKLYDTVEVANQMKRYDLALAYLELFLVFDEKSARYHALRGRILLRLGDNDEAVRALKKARSLDPHDCAALYHLGSAYFQNDNFKLAEQVYKQTLAICPDYAEALVDLSAIYCDYYGDLDAALAYVEKGLQANQELAVGWVNRGIILENAGDFHQAIQSFDRALAIEPDNTFALLRKGALLNDRLGLYDEAVRLFNRVARNNPENTECWWDLSQAFMAKGEYEKAIEYLDQLLSIDPQHFEAYFNKALLQSRLGWNSAAKITVRQVLKIDPGNKRAEYILKTLDNLPDDGIPGQLFVILTSLSQIDPDTKECLEAIAQNGDSELASMLLTQLRKSLSSDNAQPELASVAKMAGDAFSRSDMRTLATWLAERGAAQISRSGTTE